MVFFGLPFNTKNQEGGCKLSLLLTPSAKRLSLFVGPTWKIRPVTAKKSKLKDPLPNSRKA